jgi:ethanolamine transporter EutH
MTSLIRQRFIASSDYDNLDDVDQTEVSKFLIIILTLALILLIEGLRRKIDALAHGHQFFQAVLELIYREVTTLGIVEFFLYLVHKYSDAYSSQTEGEDL